MRRPLPSAESARLAFPCCRTVGPSSVSWRGIRRLPQIEQGFTQRNAVGHVHAEHNDGRPANLRLADEGDSLPAEVSSPFLASWIEFGHCFFLRCPARTARALA